MKKIFTICCLLIITAACNESKLSHEKISDLSLIRADVYIYQRMYDKKDNQVIVHLYDEEGKTIKNDSVKIYVNGTPVKYTVQQELYYTTSTFYLKDSAAPKDNKFYFEIELSEGKKFFLAEINALELVSSKNITCSEKGDFNKDIDVRWKDLRGMNYVIISTSRKVKKKDDPNVTTYEGQPDDTLSIQPTGQHIIAKSTFDNPLSQLSTVSFKFVATAKGNVNPQLIKGSEINIQGNIEESIFFGN